MGAGSERPVLVEQPAQYRRTVGRAGTGDRGAAHQVWDGEGIQGAALLPERSTVLAAKLRAPLVRPEHVSRPRLLALLNAATTRRLTLVDAPAGSGKSTLLAEFCAAATPERHIAWVSLDEDDNDPAVFWLYVIHALHQVVPDRFNAPLVALGRPGASLTRTVLPPLLNELWAITEPVVLVLDDFHAITDAGCHESLRFFLDRLPPAVRVVLATRSDPPLGLGRLRARGELGEVRAADLAFRDEEVKAFFNDSHNLGLTPDDLARVAERTEGWAAGLYLAALSLRDRRDAQAFIAEFAGDHRHVVDYLGGEELDRLTAEERAFLLQTSILESFTAPLCDAVTGGMGAAERLRVLAAANQFLIPLDERYNRYRYHHLFSELLQVELKRAEPDLVPILHRRAAAWYHAVDDATAAMRHALAAGDVTLAGDLFLEYAQPFLVMGRLATVVNWMDQLPDDAIAARPALALAVVWVAGSTSRPAVNLERWLTVAEASDYQGPFPFGEHSMRSAVALVRSFYLRALDDVGRALQAGQIAVELETDPGTLSYLLARGALGQALYMAGRPAEARAPLEAAIHAPLADRQTVSLIRAIATLALVCLDLGEADRSEDLARRAVGLCEANGLGGHSQAWFAYLALGTVLFQRGLVEEAESLLAHGVEPHMYGFDRWPISYAQALLALAPVRFARGHVLAAQSLVDEARAVIAGCKDPGMLPTRLDETVRMLHRIPRRPTGLREALSEGELRVLRLLASDLSQREIGRELYLSVNTIKTHTRSIYTKLDAASRDEAVARARALGLIA